MSFRIDDRIRTRAARGSLAVLLFSSAGFGQVANWHPYLDGAAQLGTALCAVSDVDGDGVGDLVVSGAGGEVLREIRGPDSLGYGLCSLPDRDGDGSLSGFGVTLAVLCGPEPALVVGAPWRQGLAGGVAAGAVHVFELDGTLRFTIRGDERD